MSGEKNEEKADRMDLFAVIITLTRENILEGLEDKCELGMIHGGGDRIDTRCLE